MIATTARPIPPEAEFPILRAGGWLLCWIVLGAAVAYAACMALGETTHANLNLLAAAVCGGSGLVGLLPVWLGSKTAPDAGAMGFMSSILFRMMVAGGVVFYAQWASDWAHAYTFSLWVAGWYLAVLLLEVKLVSSHVLKFAGPQNAPGTPPGNTPGDHADPSPYPVADGALEKK